MHEYLRPWKLISLGIGVALLIVGSFLFPTIDWDITISLIMSFLTYLSAPWALRVFLNRQWLYWPAALFATWFTVDGCYWIYWSLTNPEALVMRSANFGASLALYGICGALWLYRGSLPDFLAEVRRRAMSEAKG
jgi:hypothetical protein